MRRPGLLGLAIAAAAALGSACWVRLGSGAGTVTLSWTAQPLTDSANSMLFDQGCVNTQGQGTVCSCRSVGITRVRAVLDGRETTFICDDLLDGGTSGTFDSVSAGTGSFTLTGEGPVFDEALDRAVLQPLYWAGGSLDVAESSSNLEAAVTLAPLQEVGGTGDIELLWTFSGLTCAEAGNPEVEVSAGPAEVFFGEDAGALFTATVPCHDKGIDGMRLTQLSATSDLFTLTAYSGEGNSWTSSPTAFTNGITEAALEVDLLAPSAATGVNSPLQLSFNFGADGGSCQQAGVDEVRVQLSSNQLGVWSPLAFDQTIPCKDPVSLSVLEGNPELVPGCMTASCPLQAGQYLVYAQGISGGDVTYQLDGVAVWFGAGGQADEPVPGESYVLNVPPKVSP